MVLPLAVQMLRSCASWMSWWWSIDDVRSWWERGVLGEWTWTWAACSGSLSSSFHSRANQEAKGAKKSEVKEREGRAERGEVTSAPQLSFESCRGPQESGELLHEVPVQPPALFERLSRTPPRPNERKMGGWSNSSNERSDLFLVPRVDKSRSTHYRPGSLVISKAFSASIFRVLRFPLPSKLQAARRQRSGSACLFDV
jgi:hypothetical protein